MQEHRGEMSIEEEQKLKKKVLKGNWGIAKDKASIHASMEKVQSYEEAFAKIQASAAPAGPLRRRVQACAARRPPGVAAQTSSVSSARGPRAPAPPSTQTAAAAHALS